MNEQEQKGEELKEQDAEQASAQPQEQPAQEKCSGHKED